MKKMYRGFFGDVSQRIQEQTAPRLLPLRVALFFFMSIETLKRYHFYVGFDFRLFVYFIHPAFLYL